MARAFDMEGPSRLFVVVRVGVCLGYEVFVLLWLLLGGVPLEGILQQCLESVETWR